MSWVSWLKICNLKKNGELGIRNLRLVNKSLLAKWQWRYARDKHALWRKIICGKTGSDENSLVPIIPTGKIGRSMWMEISKDREFYEVSTVQLGLRGAFLE